MGQDFGNRKPKNPSFYAFAKKKCCQLQVSLHLTALKKIEIIHPNGIGSAYFLYFN